tara:strand:+ start:799 stop:1299 length:501 start_codon:yes stop_codon:yes gene_type:complete
MALIKINNNTLSAVSELPSGISGQNYPAFFANLSSNQLISTSTATKVQFDSELFDTDSCYDNSTNYRFTPNVAGKYLLTAGITFTALNDQKQAIIYFYKNGTNVGFLRNINAKTTANLSITYTIIVDANGTSDYFEVFAYQDNGNSRDLTGNSGSLNYFGAYRIGD